MVYQGIKVFSIYIPCSLPRKHVNLVRRFRRCYLQEAQLMLTTGSTRLAVSQGQQIWYHSTCNIRV